ncbi:cytochrome P450 4C1-like [Brevipalpus obovatus]|uniref:cytochrome P450 4C1-like n=1 Tax=Brevipalpus obovatus TaxID=246614 RepID=UPI003D9EA085
MAISLLDISWYFAIWSMGWLFMKLFRLLKLYRALQSIPHYQDSSILLGDLKHLKRHSGEPDSKAISRFIIETHEQFKNHEFYVFWRSWYPTLIIHGRQAIEDVLSNKNILRKGVNVEMIKDWIGDGLLTSTGEKWKERRKLITPAFHFKILEDFVPSIVSHTSQLLDEWAKKDVQIIDVHKAMPKLTLDILFETAMGLSSDEMVDERLKYVEAIKDATSLSSKRFHSVSAIISAVYYRTRAGKEYLRALDIIHGFTSRVIKQRIATIQSKNEHENLSSREESDEKINSAQDNVYFRGKKRKQAFMDTLIDEFLTKSRRGSRLKLEDIREEVDTFMFAGHDTTATALTYTVFLLGCFPNVQEKLYEELLSNGVFDRETQKVDNQKLNSLPYFEACLKESLRLFPPVPIIQKAAPKDLKICGQSIPEGLSLSLHLYFLHKDPEIFPDPEKFDPERFMDSRSQNIPPFSYVPFSAGPRNCVGQKFALLEMKIFLSLLLMRFKLRSFQKPDEIDASFEIVLRPTSDILVEITKR